MRRAQRQDAASEPWFHLPPCPACDAPVLVIGAGLAGCWLARELSARGRRTILVDRHAAAGQGASGNPVGIVKPFVTRVATAAESFHDAAFEHLLERLATGDLAARARFAQIGVVQLVARSFDRRDDLVRLAKAQTNDRTACSLDSASLAFERGGWLDPSALCTALLAGEPGSAAAALIDTRLGNAVVSLERVGDRWRATLADGDRLHADGVVLASGPAIADSCWTAHLPLTPARGQLDRIERGALAEPRAVVTGSSWMIPDGDAVWAGATFERDDQDEAIRQCDSTANRAALETLAGGRPGESLSARAGVRATTPDRLPIVGPVAWHGSLLERYADLPRGRAPEHYAPPDCVPGLAVSGGLGSRGIVTAALCASLLADWYCGDAAPLQAWHRLLAPHRFLIRQSFRGHAGR